MTVLTVGLVLICAAVFFVVLFGMWLERDAKKLQDDFDRTWDEFEDR